MQIQALGGSRLQRLNDKVKGGLSVCKLLCGDKYYINIKRFVLYIMSCPLFTVKQQRFVLITDTNKFYLKEIVIV